MNGPIGKTTLVLTRCCIGPGYTTDAVFNLSTMQPYNLRILLDAFHQHCKDIILYLPRNSDMRQLARAATKNEKTTVIHYCIEGASKVIVACPRVGCRSMAYKIPGAVRILWTLSIPNRLYHRLAQELDMWDPTHNQPKPTKNDIRSLS